MLGDPERMTGTQIESWQRSAGKQLLARVGVAAGDVVLDFGCREGNYAEVAARIVGPTGIVYALDKDRQTLDELIRRTRAKDLDNIVRLDTSGNVPIPLPDASVDAALLYDVLHLIGWSGQSDKTVRRSTAADRRGILGELFRISRPMGVISVYCPHLATHTDVHTEQDIAEELEGEGFGLRDDFHAELVHDGRPARGHVMNFLKPDGMSRRAC